VLERSELGDLETLTATLSLLERGCIVRDDSVSPPERAPPPLVSKDTPGNVVSFMPIVASQHAPSEPPARPSIAFVAMGLLLGTAGWAAVNVMQGGSLRAMFSPARPEPAPASAPEPPRTFTIDSRAQPPQAEFWLDGVKLETGRLRRELPRDGAPHALKVVAEGYAPTTLLFVDAAPPALITLEKLAVPVPVPPPAAPPHVEPRTEPAADPADARRPPPRARRPVPPRAPTESPPPAPAPGPAPGTGAPAGAAGEPKPVPPRVQIIERATPNVQVIE
jgi:hypothetical protein